MFRQLMLKNVSRVAARTYCAPSKAGVKGTPGAATSAPGKPAPNTKNPNPQTVESKVSSSSHVKINPIVETSKPVLQTPSKRSNVATVTKTASATAKPVKEAKAVPAPIVIKPVKNSNVKQAESTPVKPDMGASKASSVPKEEIKADSKPSVNADSISSTKITSPSPKLTSKSISLKETPKDASKEEILFKTANIPLTPVTKPEIPKVALEPPTLLVPKLEQVALKATETKAKASVTPMVSKPAATKSNTPVASKVAASKSFIPVIPTAAATKTGAPITATKVLSKVAKVVTTKSETLVSSKILGSPTLAVTKPIKSVAQKVVATKPFIPVAAIKTTPVHAMLEEPIFPVDPATKTQLETPTTKEVDGTKTEKPTPSEPKPDDASKHQTEEESDSDSDSDAENENETPQILANMHASEAKVSASTITEQKPVVPAPAASSSNGVKKPVTISSKSFGPQTHSIKPAVAATAVASEQHHVAAPAASSDGVKKQVTISSKSFGPQTHSIKPAVAATAVASEQHHVAAPAASSSDGVKKQVTISSKSFGPQTHSIKPAVAATAVASEQHHVAVTAVASSEGGKKPEIITSKSSVPQSPSTKPEVAAIGVASSEGDKKPETISSKSFVPQTPSEKQDVAASSEGGKKPETISSKSFVPHTPLAKPDVAAASETSIEQPHVTTSDLSQDMGKPIYESPLVASSLASPSIDMPDPSTSSESFGPKPITIEEPIVVKSSETIVVVEEQIDSNPVVSTPSAKDVPGLSTNCVIKKEGPLGPGASATSEYKVPEYFCYNRATYFEAEVEMEKFRCPQPSAL